MNGSQALASRPEKRRQIASSIASYDPVEIRAQSDTLAAMAITVTIPTALRRFADNPASVDCSLARWSP